MSQNPLKRMPVGKTEIKGTVKKASGRNFTINVPNRSEPLVWASAFYDNHKQLWWGMIDDDTLCWWKHPVKKVKIRGPRSVRNP